MTKIVIHVRTGDVVTIDALDTIEEAWGEVQKVFTSGASASLAGPRPGGGYVSVRSADISWVEVTESTEQDGDGS
jgi:hypothetical protein